MDDKDQLSWIRPSDSSMDGKPEEPKVVGATNGEVVPSAAGVCADVLTPTVNDWRGVALLALAWGATLTTFSCCIAAIAVAAKPMSPSTATDTLPLACLFFAVGIGNVLLPFKIKRLERKKAYLVGCLTGASGCAVITAGCVLESFALICIGACLQGMSAADGQNYRFASSLLAPSAKEVATGSVLFGGVFGAILGPGVIVRAKHLLTYDFAGIFLLCIGMHAIAFVLISCVQFPTAKSPQGGVLAKSRPLSVIFAQPLAAAGMLGTSMAYVIMMLIMAPTPLVMTGEFGFSLNEAGIVMMVHMVLMFAPSIFTAKMIVRFGPMVVAIHGCCLCVICGFVNLAGAELPNFMIALALLGLFWNNLFLASTALLQKSFEPHEGPKAQALNDGVASTLTGTCTLMTASLVDTIGWNGENITAIAAAVATGLALVVLWLLADRRRKQKLQQEAKSQS